MSDFIKHKHEKSKTVLVFDFHNLMYRNVFAAIRSEPSDNKEYYLTRHFIMNSIFDEIKTHQPDRVVFAIDSTNTWRKDIYPGYKAKRHDRASGLNTECFYPIMDKFIEDMKDFFKTICFLQVAKSEADDIIGVICKNNKRDRYIIVSTDSDMIQLLVNKNVQIWNPKKKEWVVSINPRRDLEIKIIGGDSGDSIKGVRSRVGPGTAEKIVVEGIMHYIDTLPTENEKGEVLEKYKLNKTLIDMDFTPNDIKEKILYMYAEFAPGEIERIKVQKFFASNKLIKSMGDWSAMSGVIRALQ